MMLIVPAGREGKIKTTPYQEQLCKVLRKAPDKRGKAVPVRLHQDVVAYLDALARKKGMKRSTLIRYIISLYLAKTACRRHVSQ
jgi:predicted DNA binding CopG/RHH family protein